MQLLINFFTAMCTVYYGKRATPPFHRRLKQSAATYPAIKRVSSSIGREHPSHTTDMYQVPDAVPPIHAVSSHVATDKDPSKFRSIFSDNLQPIATRGKIARGTLLVDIGCSSEHAPPSVSY